MQTASNLYEDVALTYTHLIYQDSQEAAAAIELIRTAFGPRTALRAALIITLVKMEVQQNHWVPNIGFYTHLLAVYPEAVRLTKYAMTCCLQSWGVSVPEPSGWTEVALAC